MELFERIESIKSKKELIEFLSFLSSDLKTNKEEWENPTLEDYFESIEGWLEDTEDENIKENTYAAIAKILYMGKIYE